MNARIGKWRGFGAVLVAGALAVVGYLGWHAYQHHIAMAAIDDVGGHRSVWPGWPNGAAEVGLGTTNCGPLSEARIIQVLEAQRLNRSLDKIDLAGQGVTNEVAKILTRTRASELVLTECALTPQSAATLMRLGRIEVIWVAPDSKAALENARVEGHDVTIHVIEPNDNSAPNLHKHDG